MVSLAMIARISSIARDYAMISSIVTLIRGLLGNALNILAFTKLKVFRDNQCIFYLIAEPIVDLAAVIYYFVNRIFSYLYGSD